jgi:hypothetical protein
MTSRIAGGERTVPTEEFFVGVESPAATTARPDLV